MTEINIGERLIGDSHPPFIVAEAGINHNGDIDLALKMIDVAIEAGVDAIKFQTFKAEEFCGDPNQMFTYTSQGERVTESMMDMFSRYEFSADQWVEIRKYCDQVGILFFSTPQNVTDLELLLEIGISAIKVGSDDLTNIPLLKQYALSGLPMIISSGMADIADCHNALDAIGAFDGHQTILCLCTSEYPTPPEDVNLRKLKTLKSAFPGVVMGFSDHTKGALASSLAVTLGACFFEKHFTLDQSLAGPDHWFSENPISLNVWCESIRQSSVMMGSSIVRPTKAELKMRTLARRSIVALNDIAKGDLLSTFNIGLRRPGSGLSPVLFDNVINRAASRNIKKGELLGFGDFS